MLLKELRTKQRGEFRGVPGSNEEIDADGSPAVRLQKDHQEAKADEDHDMNILEHWSGERDDTFGHTQDVLNQPVVMARNCTGLG